MWLFTWKCDVTLRTFPTSQLFLRQRDPQETEPRFELGSKLAEGRHSNNVATSADSKFSYPAPLATILNTVQCFSRRNFWAVHVVSTCLPHCEENPIYVFPEKKLRGLIPNFYIHLSVSDLYTPLSFHLFPFRQVSRRIAADIWM